MSGDGVQITLDQYGVDGDGIYRPMRTTKKNNTIYRHHPPIMGEQRTCATVPAFVCYVAGPPIIVLLNLGYLEVCWVLLFEFLANGAKSARWHPRGRWVSLHFGRLRITPLPTHKVDRAMEVEERYAYEELQRLSYNSTEKFIRYNAVDDDDMTDNYVDNMRTAMRQEEEVMRQIWETSFDHFSAQRRGTRGRTRNQDRDNALWMGDTARASELQPLRTEWRMPYFPHRSWKNKWAADRHHNSSNTPLSPTRYDVPDPRPYIAVHRRNGTAIPPMRNPVIIVHGQRQFTTRKEQGKGKKARKPINQRVAPRESTHQTGASCIDDRDRYKCAKSAYDHLMHMMEQQREAWLRVCMRASHQRTLTFGSPEWQQGDMLVRELEGNHDRAAEAVRWCVDTFGMHYELYLRVSGDNPENTLGDYVHFRPTINDLPLPPPPTAPPTPTRTRAESEQYEYGVRLKMLLDFCTSSVDLSSKWLVPLKNRLFEFINGVVAYEPEDERYPAGVWKRLFLDLDLAKQYTRAMNERCYRLKRAAENARERMCWGSPEFYEANPNMLTEALGQLLISDIVHNNEVSIDDAQSLYDMLATTKYECDNLRQHVAEMEEQCDDFTQNDEAREKAYSAPDTGDQSSGGIEDNMQTLRTIIDCRRQQLKKISTLLDNAMVTVFNATNRAKAEFREREKKAEEARLKEVKRKWDEEQEEARRIEEMRAPLWEEFDRELEIVIAGIQPLQQSPESPPPPQSVTPSPPPHDPTDDIIIIDDEGYQGPPIPDHLTRAHDDMPDIVIEISDCERTPHPKRKRQTPPTKPKKRAKEDSDDDFDHSRDKEKADYWEKQKKRAEMKKSPKKRSRTPPPQSLRDEKDNAKRRNMGKIMEEIEKNNKIINEVRDIQTQHKERMEREAKAMRAKKRKEARDKKKAKEEEEKRAKEEEEEKEKKQDSDDDGNVSPVEEARLDAMQEKMVVFPPKKRRWLELKDEIKDILSGKYADEEEDKLYPGKSVVHGLFNLLYNSDGEEDAGSEELGSQDSEDDEYVDMDRVFGDDDYDGFDDDSTDSDDSDEIDTTDIDDDDE